MRSAGGPLSEGDRHGLGGGGAEGTHQTGYAVYSDISSEFGWGTNRTSRQLYTCLDLGGCKPSYWVCQGCAYGAHVPACNYFPRCKHGYPSHVHVRTHTHARTDPPTNHLPAGPLTHTQTSTHKHATHTQIQTHANMQPHKHMSTRTQTNTEAHTHEPTPPTQSPTRPPARQPARPPVRAHKRTHMHTPT